MQPKHLSAMMTLLLTIVLLAGCAAPAAAPTAAPVATPVPPPVVTPEPIVETADPAAPILAWADAIYRGDIDAALEQFTDDGNYMILFGATGQEQLRWLFDFLASFDMKQENFDCQPRGDNVVCNYTVLHGCMAASGSTGLPTKATFVLEDGKIKIATGSYTGPEWDAYWDFESQFMSWARAFRPDAYDQLMKAEGTAEGGRQFVKLCREYGELVKTQEPATAAAAQGLVEALNGGDTDSALALFTQSDETKFRIMSDEVIGADQLGAMFDWLAGKGTRFQIADCEWQGIGTQCAATVTDDCIAASGAGEGLHGKMTFYSEEDGMLRHVIVVPIPVERKAYEAWLEAEATWAAEAHAGELAQAEGYSRAAGEMAVQLCREYATAQK